MTRSLAALALALSFATGCPATTDGGCEVSGCEDGEACVHQAWDLPGSCAALPTGCDPADPCACADLDTLCLEAPTDLVCEQPAWADADLVCN